MNSDDKPIRMPFKPIDYGGELNSIKRKCRECENEYAQGEMKEFRSMTDGKNVYHDDQKWWDHSVFICENCWSQSEFSDAANWTG